MKTQRTKIFPAQLLRGAVLAYAIFSMYSIGVSQTVNLSGIVNTYTKVTSAYANTVRVSSAAGFAVGDNVLIIQMNGAAINTANNSSYGTITEYGGAGSYELASISSVRGTILTLNNKLINTYDSSQSVQLIKVPSYSDITVSGTINAQAWNGTTGGVVALMASGSVTLKADINVNGAGFRAGASDVVINNNGTNRRCDSINYFYTGTGSPAASKGEGIATPNAQNTYPAGMGAMANAGGGANTEEGGGAGGGNYGTGGNGGANSGSQQCTSNEGIGGNGLLYSNAFGHIYMGGGGGGGHTDDNGGVGGIGTPGAGGPGANGGGIVIIQADTIIGNGRAILANGNNAPNAEEGTGGGGAGGTVLLDATTYISAINVQMNGGIGGSNQNDESTFNFYECSGSGGGGAGGALWVNTAKVDPNIQYSVSGGAAGTAQGAGDCSGSVGQVGQPGGVLTKLVIPAANVQSIINICASFAPTAAPASVAVAAAVDLADSITVAMDSIVFDMLYQPSALMLVSTTPDSCAFTKRLIAPGDLRVTLTGCPSPLTPGILFSAVFQPVMSAKDTNYTTVAIDSIHIYPPQAVQVSGCSVPFTVLPVCGLSGGVFYTSPSTIAQNYPNPFTDKTTIPVTLSNNDAGIAQLKVYDIFGKQVADLSAQANSGNVELDGNSLPTGVYAYVLQTPSTKITRQFFVVH